MNFKEICNELQRFDEEYIPFPPFVVAVDAVKTNLALFRETGIAQHLLVLGESGAGKSSLCSLMSNKLGIGWRKCATPKVPVFLWIRQRRG